MFDKRRSTRRRTLLRGRIEIEKLNGWAVDCTVRDVSEAGASLLLPAETLVPDRFSLGISDQGPETARLVWYRDGRAGVELPDRGRSDIVAADEVAPATWDGTCRRSPASRSTASDPLAARVAAIVARRPHGERRRSA